MCDETFSSTSDLEKHMVTFHTCKTCTILFYCKWRLEKHLQVHKKWSKPCKYENLDRTVDEVGCKFKYEGNIRLSDNRCEKEVFRIFESDMDAQRIDQTYDYDPGADEQVKAVESNTDYEKVRTVDLQEYDETEC